MTKPLKRLSEPFPGFFRQYCTESVMLPISNNPHFPANEILYLKIILISVKYQLFSIICHCINKNSNVKLKL